MFRSWWRPVKLTGPFNYNSCTPVFPCEVHVSSAWLLKMFALRTDLGERWELQPSGWDRRRQPRGNQKHLTRLKESVIALLLFMASKLARVLLRKTECVSVCACKWVLPLGLNCMQDMGLSWAGKWATTPSPSESSLTRTWSTYTDTHARTRTHAVPPSPHTGREGEKNPNHFLTMRTLNPEWDFPLLKDFSSHFGFIWYHRHSRMCCWTSPRRGTAAR